MTHTTTYSEIKSSVDNHIRRHYQGCKLGGFTHQKDTENYIRFTELVSRIIKDSHNLKFKQKEDYLTSFEFQNKVYLKLSNSREIVCDDFRLVFSPHGKDGVELYKIEVFNQGKGLGSQLLELFNTITKETGITVYLRPVSFGSTEIDQLRKWYSRNGFKRCCKNLYWSNK